MIQLVKMHTTYRLGRLQKKIVAIMKRRKNYMDVDELCTVLGHIGKPELIDAIRRLEHRNYVTVSEGNSVDKRNRDRNR